MRLRDVIDFETQLSRDAIRPTQQLASRDERLLRSIGKVPGNPARLVVAWLHLLRAQGSDSFPGHQVEVAVRLVRFGAILAGLLLGWGSIAAVLGIDGSRPVNVWHFLLIFVVAQAILLGMLLSSVVLGIGRGKTDLGPLLEVVAGLVRRVAGWTTRRSRVLRQWEALAGRLQVRRSLYSHLQPWLLLELTQSFGVAFNLGAVSGALGYLLFTDIAFYWSTTLTWLSPERFHGITSALARPWSSIFPDAVPSLFLVQATQYSRMAGAYVSPHDLRGVPPELPGGWWSFLLAALVTYGLLPRLLALGVAVGQFRWRLARLPFDDPDSKSTLRRLLGLVDDGSAGVPSAAGSRRSDPATCDLVRWRDAVSTKEVELWLRRALGLSIHRTLSAGAFPYEGDAGLVLGARPGQRPLILLAEVFEPPDKALARFLLAARAATSPTTDVRVLLASVTESGLGPPPPADVALWNDFVRRLGDPYIRAEPLEALP
jgi:Protein of unknown function (DUF2868)